MPLAHQAMPRGTEGPLKRSGSDRWDALNEGAIDELQLMEGPVVVHDQLGWDYRKKA
jgi:hypothetical protein